MGKKNRYKHWWYENVARQLKRFRTIEKENTIQAALFMNAYNSAVSETLSMYDKTGPIRIEAIKLVYINQSHNVEGAANVLHISRATLCRYISNFVYLVGTKEGY